MYEKKTVKKQVKRFGSATTRRPLPLLFSCFRSLAHILIVKAGH